MNAPVSAPSVYRSECGQYLCRPCRRDGAGGTYEAWTVDGSIHWRDDNRVRTWQDGDKALHPMERCVGGFSAQKTGQKKGSFTLNLLHCDTTKIIEAFKGNTIIESFDIVFRRKVPPQNVPHWLKERQP